MILKVFSFQINMVRLFLS